MIVWGEKSNLEINPSFLAVRPGIRLIFAEIYIIYKGVNAKFLRKKYGPAQFQQFLSAVADSLIITIGQKM